MKDNVKRIATGIVFVIVIVSVLVLNNAIIDTVFVTLLSLCGIYEYNKCFRAKEIHPIPLVGYMSCFIIPLLGTTLDLNIKLAIGTIWIILSLIYMFTYIVIKKLEINIVDIAVTMFSVIFVPFMFSFLKLLLLLPHGRIYLLLAFGCSTATDTFAYEIGSRFGKHKLTPVSPKKSVEGSLAGVIGTMIVCAIISAVTNTYYDTNFNIILVVLMSAILSVVGQIGDLAASSVKRYCGVKDYGNLMPGHGGILDRFDSILFIAPVLYALVYISSII